MPSNTVEYSVSYGKLYYQKNKEWFKAYHQSVPVINCEVCGGRYKRNMKMYHFKTRKHQRIAPATESGRSPATESGRSPATESGRSPATESGRSPPSEQQKSPC